MPLPYNSTHSGAAIDEAVDIVQDLGTAAGKDAGVALGVATLDSGGKVPTAQLPTSIVGALNYKGVWNANTNSPSLASGVGTQGDYYKVSVAGTTTIDSVSEWSVGDFLAFNGTIWDKIDNTENDASSTVKGVVKLAQDLAGTAALPEVVAARKSFKLPGVISPSISASQDDWAPTGLADAAVIRVTVTGIIPLNITGLTGGADGRIIVIQFESGVGLVLKHNVTSTAANRFTLTSDFSMAAGDAIALIYDGTATRWLPLVKLGANSLPLAGGTLTGELILNHRIRSQRWTNQISALTYAGTTDLDFDGYGVRTLSLTGDVTFTTSNKAQGRLLKIHLSCDGTPRNFTFPSWIWFQTPPTAIAASKKGLLTLECAYGANDTDITACYVEQP